MAIIYFQYVSISSFYCKDIINASSTSPTPTLFHHPRFKGFIQRNPDDIPTISTSIIDTLYSALEPSYLPCINTFDGWFGISFKYTNYFTYGRSLHPSEILTLYSLSALISLYPCTISAEQIRTLLLQTLPFRESNHVANKFLSNIIPPAIPPSTHIQCLSNCFTLQTMPAKYTWYTAYQQDSDTKIFIDHFSVNTSFDQSTILTLQLAYRAALSRNQLGILEDRLVYYE